MPRSGGRLAGGANCGPLRRAVGPGAFEAEVAAGTFPGPFPLRKVRRRLWDLAALDAALDRKAGADDREARKLAWQAAVKERDEGFAERSNARAIMLRRK